MIDLKKLQAALNSPPGYGRLMTFCEQVEAGNPPDPDTLRDLAAAFRKMLAEADLKKRPAVFAREMKLHGSKGLKKPTALQESPRLEAAIEVFLLDPDGTDQAGAIAKIAGERNADISTVGRWVKRHHDSAQWLARWILDMEKRRRKE